jgi:hypothetical protein
MLFMIYGEHGVTVDCKHLARYNCWQKDEMVVAVVVGGRGVSRSSTKTTEREVGVIKLSIAVKRHAPRFLSGKNNSSGKSGPYRPALQ